MAAWTEKDKEEIEFRIKAVRQFLEMWTRYDQLMQHAYHDQVAGPEEEEEFLKLKSQCARRHQYLIEYLGQEYKGAEPITPFLSDTVTMKTIIGIHEDFYKKLCLQWHHTFLRLNEAFGYLRTHLELETPL